MGGSMQKEIQSVAVRFAAAGVIAGLLGALLVRRVPSKDYGCYASEDGCSDLGAPQLTIDGLIALIAAALIAGAAFWLAGLRIRPGGAGGADGAGSAGGPDATGGAGPGTRGVVVVLGVSGATAAAGLVHLSLLLAVPLRYGRIPDGPTLWPAPVVLLIAFPAIALLVRGPARRIAAGILTVAAVAAAIGVPRLHSVWGDGERRTEVADLPQPVLIPDTPGWHLAHTVIGLNTASHGDNRSSLDLVLAPVGPAPLPSPPSASASSAASPTPANSSAPVAAAADSQWISEHIEIDANQQGPPGACADSVCAADGPDRWTGHPADSPSAFSLYIRRGTTVITLSGVYQGIDLDTLHRVAASLRPARTGELTATMGGSFP